MTYAMKLNGGALVTDGKEVPYAGVSGNGWTADVISDGTGFGNPETLSRTLNALMTAGSWDEIIRFLNREPSITVEITGLTADGLNAGEVWLSGLMGPGTLEWLPPGQTIWTVFDLTQSYIKRSEDEGWDLDEPRWVRRYVIAMKALPFARSPEPTVTPAAPTAATPIVDVQVTDGSSATGWSAVTRSVYQPPSFPSTVTPTVVSGAVRATKAGGTGSIELRYAMTALPSDTPYLRIDMRYNNADRVGTLETSGGNIGASLVSITSVSGSLVTATVYYLLPVGATWIRATVLPYGGGSSYIEVDQIRRQSRLPDLGTNRQKLATLYPGGSAPAEGSLHVGHPTAALGRVLIHTYPLGRPSPALMQYRTAGTTATTDTAAINGSRTLIQADDLVLTVPDAQLPTRGRAALWAKLQVDSAPATVRWTVTPVSNGSTVGQVQTRDVLVPAGAVVLVPLGLVTLPGAATGPTGGHTFAFRRVAGTGTVSVDEVWACGMDDASALTVVDAGTGTPASGGASSQVWINAPSASRPAGEVLIGTKVEDARWPSAIQAGPQQHRFPPAGVSVLTVTCGASDASTDLTHYKRWTHHAAETS